jgi:hypothetical protein
MPLPVGARRRLAALRLCPLSARIPGSRCYTDDEGCGYQERATGEWWGECAPPLNASGDAGAAAAPPAADAGGTGKRPVSGPPARAGQLLGPGCAPADFARPVGLLPSNPGGPPVRRCGEGTPYGPVALQRHVRPRRDLQLPVPEPILLPVVRRRQLRLRPGEKGRRDVWCGTRPMRPAEAALTAVPAFLSHCMRGAGDHTNRGPEYSHGECVSGKCGCAQPAPPPPPTPHPSEGDMGTTAVPYAEASGLRGA